MPFYNTQIEQINNQLTDTGKADVSGDHESSFFEGPNLEKYLVKTSLNLITNIKNPEFYHYLEALAARFYEFFSPETYTAQTKLITTSKGEVNIGSLWIDEFIPYEDITLPFIQDNKIVTIINSHAYEIRGYISMLLTARIIGNYDCIGKGVNAGVKYNKEKNIYDNVKIDPGGSFLFVTNNPLNHIFGMAILYTHQIEQIYHPQGHELPDFVSHIPLELIDSLDATKIDPEFNDVNVFIDYFHPNYDVRDLLIDKLAYADIVKHKELYHQLVFAVHNLVSASNEDLVSLIYEEMPESINGEELHSLKSNIYDKIKLRLEKMAKIYKVELEYYKLYIEFSDSMDFETMKYLALRNAENTSETLDKLMSRNQINLAQRQFNRLLGNKIDQYIALRGIEPKESYLLNTVLNDLIKAVETEDFHMVNAILKNKPFLVSQINNVETIEENHGTSAILRTKKHQDLRIAELLLKHGANPRKQILLEEDENGSIIKIYFDIVGQLPEELQALILKREKEMGCSFADIEDLEFTELEFFFISESSSEQDEKEENSDQNIFNDNAISEIIGQNFLDIIPNYFSLFTQKSGVLVLEYLSLLSQKLNFILDYFEDIDLTTIIIFQIEDVFNSLNPNSSPWHIYLGFRETMPDEGDFGGGDYGGLEYYHQDDTLPDIDDRALHLANLFGKICHNGTTY